MTPKQFAAGMESILEWGPQRQKSDDERLAERCPEMSPREREATLKECAQVTSRAYGYAEKIKRGQMDDARSALRNEWPMLTEEHAAQAFTQAMYYHWKDTGE